MSMTQTSPCCWEREPTTSLLGFSRPFVAFLGGSLVSRMGDALFTFALPWMAYELTHSSVVLATLYATEIVPVVLFGAFAVVYVDRLNRRSLLLGADLLRVLLVAVVPLLSLLAHLQIWELYALAFSLALISLASDVAMTAVLPELAQSETTRANAAYQFIMQAAEFAGPALAGLAIATLGAFHTLWLDALSFGGKTREPHVRQVFSEVKEGLHWLWKEPVIKMLSVQAMLGNLGLGMVSAVLLYYLRTQLRLPAQLAGLDYAMIGAGCLLGSLVIVPLTHLSRRGTLYPALLLCGLLGRASMVFLPWW